MNCRYAERRDDYGHRKGIFWRAFNDRMKILEREEKLIEDERKALAERGRKEEEAREGKWEVQRGRGRGVGRGYGTGESSTSPRSSHTPRFTSNRFRSGRGEGRGGGDNPETGRSRHPRSGGAGWRGSPSRRSSVSPSPSLHY